MFTSIEDVQEKLKRQRYIANRHISTVVYLSTKMSKPLLVEGPAGVGKTDLAKVIASALGQELIRLQCYEGLDEAKALYEWEYSKQLLYTQILKDKIGETIASCSTIGEAMKVIEKEDNVFFSRHFLLPRPLLRAITSDEPSVLLIDEVDKSDSEFEAFLLEVLSDFQVSVPELGTIAAKHVPVVVLTSNNAREMSDALKRRCLHLWIDFPVMDQEVEIVRLKVPNIARELAEQVVHFIHGLRELDLKKVPSISETLDWARALTILNADSLDEDLIRDTLTLALKYETDVRAAQKEMSRLIKRKTVEHTPPVIPDKGDILH